MITPPRRRRRCRGNAIVVTTDDRARARARRTPFVLVVIRDNTVLRLLVHPLVSFVTVGLASRGPLFCPSPAASLR